MLDETDTVPFPFPLNVTPLPSLYPLTVNSPLPVPVGWVILFAAIPDTPVINVLLVFIGLLFTEPVNVRFDASTVVALDVDQLVGIASAAPPHAKLPNVSLSAATLFTVNLTLSVSAVTSPFAVASNLIIPSLYSTPNVLFVPPVTVFELLNPVAFVSNAIVLVPSVFSAVVALLENAKLDAVIVVLLSKLNCPLVKSLPVPQIIVPREIEVALSSIV